MRALPRRFTPHTIAVRDRGHDSGMGGTLAPKRAINHVWVVDQEQLIRDRNGAEVVSMTQVNINLTETIPLGSVVTIWPGEDREREATVERVDTFRHDRLPSFYTLYLV